MARNEEKQLGRLNRLILQQQKDELKKKNPKRPRLDVINTAEDIKHWLPSIKQDIDFCLKQSQVPCYPERKIKEINERIHHLQGEYKAFVRKYRKLDPDVKVTPWTERGYRKETRENKELSACDDRRLTRERCPCDQNAQSVNDDTTCTSKDLNSPCERTEKCCEKKDIDLQATDIQKDTHSSFMPIITPILDNDSEYISKFGYFNKDFQHEVPSNVNTQFLDQPLDFVKKDNKHSKRTVSNLVDSDHSCEKETNVLYNLLPYSDSSDDSDN